MKLVILMVTMAVMLAGCASTLPPKVSVGNDFKTTGVKTISVKIDCTDTKTDDINPASVPDYRKMLIAATKASIREKTGYKIVENATDVDIKITLEQMVGGNAAARFLVGLGAGRSIITTYVDVVRNGKIIAEGRLIETSTIPNIVGSAWTKEELIKQDIGIIAGKIADFVADPRNFEAKPEKPKY